VILAADDEEFVLGVVAVRDAQIVIGLLHVPVQRVRDVPLRDLERDDVRAIRGLLQRDRDHARDRRVRRHDHVRRDDGPSVARDDGGDGLSFVHAVDDDALEDAAAQSTNGLRERDDVCARVDLGLVAEANRGELAEMREGRCFDEVRVEPCTKARFELEGHRAAGRVGRTVEIGVHAREPTHRFTRRFARRAERLDPIDRSAVSVGEEPGASLSVSTLEGHEAIVERIREMGCGAQRLTAADHAPVEDDDIVASGEAEIRSRQTGDAGADHAHPGFYALVEHRVGGRQRARRTHPDRTRAAEVFWFR
jgi:hypothetical protein